MDVGKLTAARFDTEQEALKQYHSRKVMMRVFSKSKIQARTYEEIMQATTPKGKYTDVVFNLKEVDGKYMYVCQGEL